MTITFTSETHRPAFATRPTPKISYGLRFPEACAAHCKPSGSLAVSRCYIIVSSSLSKNTDALDRLKSALGGETVVGVRVGISPHTPISQVIEVIEDIRSINANSRERVNGEVDCIITLGAGSLTDAAKLVRFGLANGAKTEEDMQKLWGNKDNNPNFVGQDVIKPPKGINLVHIPTSLSGGEYQALAGGTESLPHGSTTKGNAKGAGGGNKRTFYCVGINPELVILDPELCVTTPEWVWLSSGVRAVDHCVETLCSVWDLTNPHPELQQREKKRGGDPLSAAKEGLVALVKGLLECKNDPTSLIARRTCQDGVIKAMQAISSGEVPVGASHAIGHQLGPLGVGHGETSCILLPSVCHFNMKHRDGVKSNARAGEIRVGDEIEKRQNEVKELLLSVEEVQHLLAERVDSKAQKKQTPHRMRHPVPVDDEEEVAQGDGSNINGELVLGDILYTIIGALRMPQSLEAASIGEDKFDELAKESLTDIWIKTNPVPVVEKEQVLEILRLCAKDRQ